MASSCSPTPPAIRPSSDLETGQLTGLPAGQPARPGSMGRPLPGVRLSVQDGELVLADPTSDPTFFVGYLDGGQAPEHEPWQTGDRVREDEDGYLYFEGDRKSTRLNSSHLGIS